MAPATAWNLPGEATESWELERKHRKKLDGSEDQPFLADPKPEALPTLDAGTRVPAKECGLTGLDSGGLRSSVGPAAAADSKIMQPQHYAYEIYPNHHLHQHYHHGVYAEL